MGDIIYVMTPEEAAGKNGPGNDIKMRIYRLNYVKGIDLAVMIKPHLSPRGKISAHAE